MGARRQLEEARGHWEVDTFSDLDNVVKSHGVEAYIIANYTWVRWNTYLNKWQTMVVGSEPSSGTLPS